MSAVCGASWAQLHTRQDNHTAVPVQVVVCLEQFELDGMEYRLHHGDDLM